MDKITYKINIAIDGHSSCGKSTIAKSLAKKLGYKYLDTGAMYRGVTLYSLQHGLWKGSEPNTDALAAALPHIKLDFKTVDGQNHLFLNGVDVEPDIRGMEVSNKVSPIAAIPAVRHYLVKQQQEIAKNKGVVMDGRDVGTVVLPHAEVKLFITAPAEVRAQRRYKELKEKGVPASYEEILKNVLMRDEIDSNREVGPLRKAEDAHYLDNSDMTIAQQDEYIEKIVNTALQELV